MQHATLNPLLQQISNPPAIHIGKIAVDYCTYLRQYLPENIHLVADAHTLAALPEKLLFPTLCFETSPKANMTALRHIRETTHAAEALVAIGSGSLNDLTKYASFLDGKPYAVIATAPSMNGYVSANASLTDDAGHKHTLPAHGPVAVLADLDVLTQAPLALIQAGIGDTLCRSTVQADWLLSHLLKGTPYEPKYFEWLKECEQQLISSLRRGVADAAAGAQRRQAQPIKPDISRLLRDARNDGFIKCLFTALTLSGLAMRDAGSSMPASQGEHMIAHTREMLFPQLPSHYHGLEIAVTSLTMSRIQDTTPLPPEIRQKIDAIRLPTAQLEAALTAAGCPTTPAELGWPEAQYAQCIAKAPALRDRFTFLNCL